MAPDHFLCNAAESFGKEWETVCVSGLPRTTATNQNKKENHIMRNRKNIVTYMVAALSILVTSASSSLAAPAQTYHGTLTGGTFYCDGNPVPGPTSPAIGT